MSLPLKTPPFWFISDLVLAKDSILICVDDSISIWNAWQERLKSGLDSVELRYCRGKLELLTEIEKQESQPCVYFVDYEFSGRIYTGIELVEKIMATKKPQDSIFFVTSREGERLLHTFCQKHNIFIIPKLFVFKIPIRIEMQPL